jgi:hypothetical protein
MNPRSLGIGFGLGLGLACAVTLSPGAASAFCGFYVGGAEARLYNHATQVVLMREGLRTVLSMENNYQGPPERFAMVVPVPIVLKKENVKTLSRELFDRIDKLDAPRLVEYWERDPCASDEYGYEFSDDPLSAGGFGPNDATIRVRPGPPPVQVLNRFTAGEYEIVILGAQDSLALDAWLRQNGYRIPSGAEEVLRPYVQAGMKFFVAKVDPAKVRFERGMATLSPLRFHYDTETFSLPIRLGLLNSAGVQDLIVHVLARGQRYEVANYDNVVIPTNLDVKDAAKSRFGAFYAALLDHTLAEKPRAVITEYAWDTYSCDPCPTPPLDREDLAAFGVEVLSESRDKYDGFVLTRLHARYEKDALGADLVFRAAPPITGGREIYDAKGVLERGIGYGPTNNFQARYAVRHPWGGAIVCAEPHRGKWGGKPGFGLPPVEPAQDLAFAPRDSIELASFLGQALPEAVASSPAYALPPAIPPPVQHGGCAACRAGGAAVIAGEGGAGEGDGPRAGVLASILAAATLLRRRARKTR